MMLPTTLSPPPLPQPPRWLHLDGLNPNPDIRFIIRYEGGFGRLHHLAEAGAWGGTHGVAPLEVTTCMRVQADQALR